MTSPFRPAAPPRERLLDEQPSMQGGLNTVSDEASLLPTQLRRATNARLTDFGAVTKRGGTRRTSSSALGGDILNGYTWRRDGGTQQILVVADNGTLYTATYGSFPWTYTAQTGALSTTIAPAFAQFRDASADVVYIADGSSLNKWNASTLTTTGIGGAFNVSTLAVHNQRLWGAGDSGAPDSIFYSGLNNGDSFSDASYSGSGGPGGQIVVRTFADETVVGLASVNTSLLIFHRRGISRLTGFGQDDITVAPQGVTADVGTIAPKSIVSIGNVAYFISERGLYRCNEAEVAPVATVETPDPILPLIRTLSSAQFGGIRAEFNRGTRELWISLPTIGVFQYHTLLGAWSGPWDTGYISPATTTLFETLDSNGLPVVLRGDVDGWVSLCDAPGYNKDNVAADGTGGTTVSMSVQLHRMYCGDDSVAKALRFGYVTASLNGTKSCDVTWRSDDTSGGYTLPVSFASVWGTGTWTGASQWGGAGGKNYRVQMGGTGYYIDITIIDSGTALPVFSRFKLETFALGRR